MKIKLIHTSPGKLTLFSASCRVVFSIIFSEIKCVTALNPSQQASLDFFKRCQERYLRSTSCFIVRRIKISTAGERVERDE